MDIQQIKVRHFTVELHKAYDNVLFQYNVRNLKKPLITVAMEKGKLGSWNPLSREMRISYDLIINYNWDTVIEVLKHEMAHQMVTDVWGGSHLHDQNFKTACDQLGVANWARSATGELPENPPNWRGGVRTPEEQRLMDKVEKLMALAESAEEHEAALAMERVRELYAKYNLEKLKAAQVDDYVYCVIDRKRKRWAADDTAIFSILASFFFVKPIFKDRFDAKDLETYQVVELLGSRENVLMAEYVYFFLRRTLDQLWTLKSRELGGGKLEKRSYFLGLCNGFRKKLAEAKVRSDVKLSAEVGLIKVSGDALNAYVETRYPKLSSRKRASAGVDKRAYDDGTRDGRQITIHKGVTNQSSSKGLALPAGVFSR